MSTHASFKISILVCLFLFLPGIISAKPPDIPKAIEVRLNKGTGDEIRAFIQQREAMVEELILEVEAILQTTTDKREKESLDNALDFFRGFSFQSKRLQSEVERTPHVSIKASKLPSPPYDLGVFENIVFFQQSIEQQIEENSKEAKRLHNKLSGVKNNLETLVSDYSRTKTSDPERSKAYEKLGYILGLQTEYALLTFKNSRLLDHLNALLKVKGEAEQLSKTCFENLRITDKDISAAEEGYERIRREAKTLSQRLDGDRKELDSKMMHYELKLDNLMSQLAEIQGDTPQKESLLQEKRHIETFIDTIRMRFEKTEQERANLEIKELEAAFRYDWPRKYAGLSNEKTSFVLQEEWEGTLEKLDRMLLSLEATLSEVNLTKSLLTQRALNATSEKEYSSTGGIRDALPALEEQLSKADDLAGGLVFDLLNNKRDIMLLSDEIRLILGFVGSQMSWYKRTLYFGKAHFSKTLTNVGVVITYPLFTIGNTTITLSSVMKVLFLLFAGVVLLRLIRRKLASLLVRRAGLSTGAVNSITTLGYYFALALGILVILSSAGIDLSQISIILGALGVGIGFGLQTIANNFISGIILLTERSIRVGDFVNLEDGILGEVQKVTIRATIIRTPDGEDIIVPNSEFVSGRVNTWTFGDDWRRLKIPFGVSYGSDPELVSKLALEVAREVAITEEDEKHPIRVFFEGFGESSLDFSIRVWCRMSRLRAKSSLLSEYYFVLFKKLKEAGIVIPFPQRDLHVQSVSQEASEIFKKTHQTKGTRSSRTNNQ